MAAYRTTSLSPPTSGSGRVNVGTSERIASAAGGAALVALGLKKGSLGGLALALTGGALVGRGLSGYCPVNAAAGRDTAEPSAHRDALELTTALTVQALRDEVYTYWRRLENLPAFMEHLRDVRRLDGGRSHWTADVPGLTATLEWDAEVVADEEGERLAWRSVPGSEVENAGEVRFRDAPGEHGTGAEVRISYRPLAGDAGRALGALLSPVFEQLVKEGAYRFKHVMEVGAVPTTDGQPSGRDSS